MGQYGRIDDRAVELWNAPNYLSLQKIAGIFGVTRQGVKKYLNKRGIDTRKQLVELTCSECGGTFLRHKAYIRDTLHPTCSTGCYYKRVKTSSYNSNRQGQRIGREATDKDLIDIGKRLMPDWVVHHKDGDTTNNDCKNRMVFADHSEHMRWHRGGQGESGVVPIWDGAKPRIFNDPNKKETEGRPKYSQAYKEKNPNDRCGDCGKGVKFCDCEV